MLLINGMYQTTWRSRARYDNVTSYGPRKTFPRISVDLVSLLERADLSLNLVSPLKRASLLLPPKVSLL
jgi:hypothetical protein